MISFYIVRHGQTILNQLERAQGWADSPLTALGEQTAQELGRSFSSVPFHAAYASDTRRALDTAKILLEAGGQSAVELHQDARLREWCLGSMEAENNQLFLRSVSEWLGGVSSLPELNQRMPEIAEAIRQHDTTGMAEPFEQISGRLQSFLHETAASAPEGSNLLLVTHALVMKTLLYLFAPEQAGKFAKISNADHLLLLFDGETFRLKSLVKS